MGGSVRRGRRRRRYEFLRGLQPSEEKKKKKKKKAMSEARLPTERSEAPPSEARRGRAKRGFEWNHSAGRIRNMDFFFFFTGVPKKLPQDFQKK